MSPLLPSHDALISEPGAPVSAVVFLATSVRIADAVVLVLLALFAWWGARRGAIRQVLSLSVLVGAFFAAGVLAPGFAPTVAKLTDLDPGPRLAVAWVVVLFAALVVGAILLRWMAARLPEPDGQGASRLIGGVLGWTMAGLPTIDARLADDELFLGPVEQQR